MNFLRIEQTYGKIGIETYNSQLQIKSQWDRLRLQQEHAKIQIDKEEPRVVIDQHECFATAGLKNPFELTEEAAQQGMQQSMEYIARYAADGDMLANIKSKGNPIAAIAARNSSEQHEFNIDLIPKARPRINVQGYLNLSYIHGGVQGRIEEGFLDIKFNEPRIKMYLINKPGVYIQYVGENVDIYA